MVVTCKTDPLFRWADSGAWFLGNIDVIKHFIITDLQEITIEGT